MHYKKPHILVIHENFGHRGGAEKLTYHIAKDLGQEFVFSCMYGQKTGQGETDWQACFPANYQIDFKSKTGLKEALEGHLHHTKPDLILAHKCENPLMLQAVVESQIPSIRWMHDHEVYCMRGYKYFPLTRKICTKKAGLCCLFPCLAFLKRDRTSCYGFQYESYCRKQAVIHFDQQFSRYIVGSYFMKEELIAQGYYEDNIEVIPYVPECSALFSASKMKRENLLLFIGQIVRGKGLDVLLASLRDVAAPYRLLVVGTGSYEQECRRLAQKLRIAEKVEFVGFLPEQEIVNISARACALVVPSVWPEPFGLVGIECMRFGLPVIGFDSGGIKDWLVNGKNGILIPWMDRRALSEAIEKILQDPQLAHDLGEGAKEFAEEEFSCSSALGQIQKIFLEGIKARKEFNKHQLGSAQYNLG